MSFISRERAGKRGEPSPSPYPMTTTMLRTVFSAPTEVAVQAAKTTVKLTTAPFHLWYTAWVVLLRLVVLTLTTPQRVFKAFTTSVNNLMGTKLRTEIASVSEYSKVLRRETRDLKERLRTYEDEMKKAEKLREHTFEEMREMRAEVVQLLDALQDKSARPGRKTSPRHARSNATAEARALRQSKSTNWLTHISVTLALGLLWNFFARGGKFETSVERKLLLALCFPMVWMYANFLFGHKTDKEDAKNRFFTLSIAWFLVGFMCCAFFHPHN